MADTAHAAAGTARTGVPMGAALLAYMALLAYGSLHPFDWAPLAGPWLAYLHAGMPPYFEKADIVQNVLVYMPFGLAVAVWRARRGARYWPAVAFAVVAGTAFSVSVETAQQYLPSRVASLTDVAMNLLGSLIGGFLAAFVSRDTRPGAQLMAWRDTWFLAGPLANMGLVVIGLWVLSQTSPLIPTLHLSQVRHGLSGLLHALRRPEFISLAVVFTVVCFVTGLGLLVRTLEQPGKPALRLHIALVGFVLCCKVIVDGRRLSAEMLAGSLLALLVLPVLCRMPARAVAHAGIALLLVGMTSYELTPSPYGGMQLAFNWVPFLGQMHSLNGFANILEFLWPFMAMAVLARHAVPAYRQREVAVFGGVLLGAFVFVLEWIQQSIDGRYGDVTQVMLALAGWTAPWQIGGHWRSHGAPS